MLTLGAFIGLQESSLFAINLLHVEVENGCVSLMRNSLSVESHLFSVKATLKHFL